MKITSGVAYFFAGLIGLTAILGGGYTLIFWGIIEPIMDICKAIDEKNVTASLIGWSIVKFFVRDLIAAAVIVVGLVLAAALVKLAD